MTEKPILFSAEMVRKILANKKTQTRRVVKQHRGWEKHSACTPDMAADPWAVWFHYPETDAVGHLVECPYGKPGTRLWVRESFAIHDVLSAEVGIGYKADHPTGDLSETDGGYNFLSLSYDLTESKAQHDWAQAHRNSERWIPSIHMPRWASRITLEVTSVRVERLCDISEQDIAAEGVSQDLVSSLIEPCALRANAKPEHWISGYDEGLSFCRKCAEKTILWLKKEQPGEEFFLGGGWRTEGDSQAFCEDCQCVLDNIFTTYACEAELDHFSRNAWALEPLDCLSLQNILGSYGWEDFGRDADDLLSPKIHRLGMQALWDSINGRDRPWNSNPFVWVVSFRRSETGAEASR